MRRTGEILVVDYIGVRTVSRLVAAMGLDLFIAGMANEIEDDYARWTQFDKSPRHAAHSVDGVIELMPTSDGVAYSFKYVNGHPKNTAAGLLTVTAFGVLADVATGYPVLLSELTLATAIRTAAMSALAARWMARPDGKTMALIGNGAQGEFQALAFHHLLGIRELRLYDTDPAASAKLERNLRGLRLPQLRIVRCADVLAAVRGADIVTTVTADKRNAIILTPEMIEPGMHLNAVGGDCPGKTELHADVLRGARVFVEFEPQTRIEGDIQQLPADFPVVDLWKVLAGTEVGRQGDDQVTVFDSVGFALEDYSTLRYVHVQALRRGIGREVDLVPRPEDPKDLFRYTRSGDARSLIRRVA